MEKIKKHKPNLKKNNKNNKDSHEYKYSLFQYMKTWHYVTHEQMHANTSRHNQFRLYNIDLNYIKFCIQDIFMCQGVLQTQINLKKLKFSVVHISRKIAYTKE